MDGIKAQIKSNVAVMPELAEYKSDHLLRISVISFLFYKSFINRYFNDVKTWLEAEFYCRTFGAGGCMGQTGQAHLVSVHSQDENDFLFSYFDTVRNKLPPAIGPIRVNTVTLKCISNQLQVAYLDLGFGGKGYEYLWRYYDYDDLCFLEETNYEVHDFV